MSKRVAVAIVCALSSLTPLAAHAQGSGTIVFPRFDGIYQQAAGGGDAVKIAQLPDDATEVRWMEATRDGRMVVIDMATFAMWLVSLGPGQPAHIQGGGCTGRGRPAPDGDAVVCPGGESATIISATRQDRTVLPGTLEDPQFRGPSGYDLAGLTDEGVVGLDRRHPEDRELLARPGARSHLLVSPNGEMAAAVFGEGMEGRIRTFHLDGKGVPRQLGGPGIPTLWSWDSQWIMFQEGDIKNAPAPASGDEGALEPPPAPWLVAAPPKKVPIRRGVRRPPPTPAPPTSRICIARATGGEVKCWDGFTGMAFSPDSTLVLLKKEKSLFIGKIAGVKPDPPVKVIDGVDGAATWTPGTVAAPIEPRRPGSKEFEL